MLRFIASAILLAFCATFTAAAEPVTLPDHLTIGYESEDQVDASLPSCMEFVKSVTEWDAKETEDAAGQVCEARQRHIDAYKAMQQKYRATMPRLESDTRIDGAAAVRHFQMMVKDCIAYKLSSTTGGHNIAIDIIPNAIAAQCLEMGSRLLD
jgi:hypothetical protein